MNKKLDPELLAYFYDIKAKISDEHRAYFARHPEIRQLLTDFMLKVLLTKPDNTFTFARDYFSYFEKKSLSQSVRHLVLAGPRGDGKGVLARMLMEAYPQYFEPNVVLTTRVPTAERPLKKDERQVTAEEMEEEQALGNLTDIQLFDGYQTATSRRTLDETLRRGKACILRVDIGRAKQLLVSDPNVNIILIIPGSLEVLKESLLNRGKVSLGRIDDTMAAVKHELEDSAKQHAFNKRILNISPDRSYEQLVYILKCFYKHFNF